MIDREQMEEYMERNGFSLFLTNGEHTYYQYTQEEYPRVACCIDTINETFQFKHVTRKSLVLQTGECGSLFLEEHFDRHLRNIVNYIANGD